MAKRPPQSVLDTLSSYPYHQMKAEEKQWVLDNTRGKPFHTSHPQKDF